MNEFEQQISELPLPEPSERLDALIREVIDDCKTNQDLGFLTPFWSLPMPVKIGSFVAISLLFGAVLTSLSVFSSVAFADVAESVKKVDTIQYVFKRCYLKKEDFPAGCVTLQSQETGEYETRADIKKVTEEQAEWLEEKLRATADQKRRAELIQRIEILRDHTQPEHGWLAHAVHIRAARGGRERREGIFPGFGVSISNAQTNKEVALDELRKTQLITKVELRNADGSKVLGIRDIQTDVISSLLSVPTKGVVDLGSKTIGGKRVIGFRHEFAMNGGTVQDDYWVDPDSRLPVQIDGRFFDKESTTPIIVTKCWGFRYNERLEDSLFDTDPPSGYEVKNATAILLEGK